MISVISIRASEELQSNYAQISSLARHNPVAITVNGKEDTVLMNHDDYVEQQNYISELEARVAAYSHVAQATENIKRGRVQKLDDAFDDIMAELNEPGGVRAVSGDEFAEKILADLIAEGLSGNELLSEFRFRKAKIRSAAEAMLADAKRAANDEGKYSTYEDIFGSGDRVDIAKSLFGVLPADVMLEEAKEEKLNQM